MTLAYIVPWITGSFGSRFQATELDVLHALDSAQKAAFAKDCRAFIRDGFLQADGAFPPDCRLPVDAGGGTIDLFARRVVLAGGQDTEGTAISYYLQPPSLTANGGMPLEDLAPADTAAADQGSDSLYFTADDEANVIVPPEWRRQVLIEPAVAFLDSGLYAEKASQSILEGFFGEWWRAMDARPNDRRVIDSAGAW